MCHSADSHPPLLPIRGGTVEARDLLLTSADGTRFASHLALVEQRGGAGVVIIHDGGGLRPFYEELARRLAEAGVHAIAVDLYARTAGTARRGEDFDAMPHVLATRHETISADVRAAVDALRALDGGPAERVFVMGFCFGGRVAFLQAAEGHGLAGVIGFYGPPSGANPAGLPEPTERAPSFACPVLGIFGGADETIVPESIAAFDAVLAAAGIEHRLITYPGAPHSFFDRTAEEHADAAADAWRQVLSFVGVPVGD